jgi:hypothetical protein
VLRKLLGAATLVAILFAVGCGGEDPPPPGTPSAAENLLSLANVKQLPKGSPEQALMGWWMHIQYNDLIGYLNGLAAPLHRAREADATTKRNLVLISGESIRSRPKIIERQRENGRMTLYTRIETRQPVGASRFTTSSSPQAFTLVREGDEWKIADDSYVLDRAGIVREAIEKAKPKR